MYLYGLSLFTLTSTRLVSNFSIVINNTNVIWQHILYYVRSKPFFSKLPYMWLISLWKSQNIITKIELFFELFYWLHNSLFHYWIPVVFKACILASYNFSNCEILLVKIVIEVLSLWFPPITSTMYSVGINGCNPYTNWYSVYHVVTLYTILYIK
jgi:hypothetical protein